MAFNLDPVSALGAIQKAKGWQGQQFSGNTSPMNFSSGLVAKSPPFQAAGGFMNEIPSIITPEAGVFTNNAAKNIFGGHVNAYGDQAELAMQALGLQGDVHRSNMQYEFAKELAEKRKKAAEEKRGGGGGGGTSGIGSTIGGIGGSLIGGPIGGTIGSMAGNFIEGLFG